MIEFCISVAIPGVCFSLGVIVGLLAAGGLIAFEGNFRRIKSEKALDRAKRDGA